jgi:hypothetical protein
LQGGDGFSTKEVHGVGCGCGACRAQNPCFALS